MVFPTRFATALLVPPAHSEVTAAPGSASSQHLNAIHRMTDASNAAKQISCTTTQNALCGANRRRGESANPTRPPMQASNRAIPLALRKNDPPDAEISTSHTPFINTAGIICRTSNGGARSHLPRIIMSVLKASDVRPKTVNPSRTPTRSDLPGDVLDPDARRVGDEEDTAAENKAPYQGRDQRRGSAADSGKTRRRCR